MDRGLILFFIVGGKAITFQLFWWSETILKIYNYCEYPSDTPVEIKKCMCM